MAKCVCSCPNNEAIGDRRRAEVKGKEIHATSRHVAALTPVTAVSLAWGAFAFGGVYSWAFTPLLLACFGIGVTSFAKYTENASMNWRLSAVLLAIAAACLVQLIPIPPALLHSISPSTDQLVRRYDIGYASGVTSHALSIDPPKTRLGLAFL